MLSVEVQKDLNKIKPKILGQLTLRSLLSIGGALAASVLVAVWLCVILKFDYDIAMYAIIIIAVPIWAIGFVKPFGFDFEKVAPLWIKHKLFRNKLDKKTSFLIDPEFCNIRPYEAQVAENKEIYKSAVTKSYARLKKRPDFEAVRIDINAEL